MPNVNDAVKQYALRLADDAVVLGHRLSELCSYGPFLEEDLALTNTALDYVGRARMFYNYAAELAADGSTEDTYAYMRDGREFSNLLINELENGDFAHTIVRQYFVDVYGLAFMQALEKSSDATLAAIASKAIKETQYHLRRSYDWMLRLGDGTDESNCRMQKAIEALWGYVPELFQMDELDQSMVEAGVGVDVSVLEQNWYETVRKTLAEAKLTEPDGDWYADGGRRGIHTEALSHLLTEMQFLQRAYPGLQW